MSEDELWLWHGGQQVAVLTSDGLGGAALRYTPEARSWGSFLSVRLPVREESYPWVQCRDFLDGLLPEDSVRSQLAVKERIPGHDTFLMLKAYGRDCAGAVQVLPPGQNPESSPQDTRWLNDGELQQAITSLPSAPLGTSIDQNVRVSLGGLQGKLLVVRRGEVLGVPLDGTPTTHILKPALLNEDGSEVWPSIAQLELLGLSLVGASVAAPQKKRQIAARAEMLTIQGRNAILVERFDRRIVDGRVIRIHQEDMCQALGSRNKYQKTAERLPSLQAIAEVLWENSASPVVERNLLARYLVANLAIGNCDMHARNIGILIDKNTVQLTPAYDVVPTATWKQHDTELSLHVGGELLLEDLTRGQILDELISWGMPLKLATANMDLVLSSLRKELPRVVEASEKEGWHTDEIDVATRGINERIVRFSG